MGDVAGDAIFLEYVEKVMGLHITPEQWQVLRTLAGAEQHVMSRAVAPYDRSGKAMFMLNYLAVPVPSSARNGVMLLSPDRRKVVEAYIEAQHRLRCNWGKVTVGTVLTVEYVAAVGVQAAMQNAQERLAAEQEQLERIYTEDDVKAAIAAAVDAERRRLGNMVRGIHPSELSRLDGLDDTGSIEQIRDVIAERIDAVPAVRRDGAPRAEAGPDLGIPTPRMLSTRIAPLRRIRA